jgi:hypothetical protein
MLDRAIVQPPVAILHMLNMSVHSLKQRTAVFAVPPLKPVIHLATTGYPKVNC